MDPCPRCGGKDIIERKASFFAVIGIIALAVFFLLSFLIPPVGIAGVIVGLAFLVYAPFAKGYYQCQKCHRLFKVRS